MPLTADCIFWGILAIVVLTFLKAYACVFIIVMCWVEVLGLESGEGWGWGDIHINTPTSERVVGGARET